MAYDFLQPVSQTLLQLVSELPPHSIGRTIDIHSKESFPELENVKIALFSVNDARTSTLENVAPVDVNSFREKFYRLFPGNWHTKIADLGLLKAGATLEDTFFAVKQLVADLLKKQILPVVIGASQDITYAIYRAYDSFEQMVNLSCIDSRIDIASDMSNPSNSFLSRIILEQPNNLLNYSNLGYQTYFNSQEEIDLVDKLFFEAYRLGEVINDITISEPILRDSDIVSIDLESVKSSDLGYSDSDFPNGFDGREICALARYAGLSDKVSSLGIFNLNNQNKSSLLIGQVLWYFIEGYNFRQNEYPYVSKQSYFKYIVPLKEQELVFYKSDISDRWWIAIDKYSCTNEKEKTLFPCSYADYQKAISNEIPLRWWKLNNKLSV